MKKLKKFLYVILALTLCISFPTSVFAEELSKEEILKIEPDVQVTFVPEGKWITITTRKGFEDYYILEDVKWEDNTQITSLPEKKVTARFSHPIYDYKGKEVARAYATVVGYYSQADHASVITSINGSVRGFYTNLFTSSTTINGHRGSLNIYHNGAFQLKFDYHISTNGHISTASRSETALLMKI